MQKESSSSVKVTFPALRREELVDRLRQDVASLAADLPLRRAVLFGSWASGRATAFSDIDVLVVYADPPRDDAYRVVRRFLTLVAYRTTNTGEAPAFYTFAFMLDEVGGTLEVLDDEEQVEGFREIAPAQLPQVAEYFEQLKTQGQYSAAIDGSWGDWGEFRAVIHRKVWEALQDQHK